MLLKKNTLPFRIKLWEFTFAILFLYTFFLQNAAVSISGMLIVLCGVLALFSALDLLIDRNGKVSFNLMFGISAFVIVSMITSFAYSNDIDDSIAAGSRMIEYVIMGCSLCNFLLRYPQRLFSVLRYIWFSITLLCIFVFFGGAEVTGAGGIGLEALNVNLLSSLITMQIFAAFLLMVQSKKVGKIIYTFSIVVVLFVQVLTASRRGFLVACAVCLLAVFFCIIPRYTTKNSMKRIFWIALIMVAFAVALVMLGDYILNETVLGSRLLGNFTSGDVARERYHTIAMEQFAKQPIFGVGLNGLQSIMGVYSHSLYYETLSCTGIIGALILFGTLFSIGKGLWKNMKESATRNLDGVYISRMSFLFFASLLIAGIALTSIYEFFFYICLGLLIAIVKIYECAANK